MNKLLKVNDRYTNQEMKIYTNDIAEVFLVIAFFSNLLSEIATKLVIKNDLINN